MDFDDDSGEVLGKESIEKIEAYYCSLCHDFVHDHREKGDEEKLIKDHCKTRRHINRYHDHKKEEERKAKAKATKESEESKSPEKSNKQNGNDEKAEKAKNDEVDRDADVNIDENTNDEKHSDDNL